MGWQAAVEAAQASCSMHVAACHRQTACHPRHCLVFAHLRSSARLYSVLVGGQDAACAVCSRLWPCCTALADSSSAASDSSQGRHDLRPYLQTKWEM